MPIVFILTPIAFEILLIMVHLAVYATLAAAFGIGGTFVAVLFFVLALTFVSASVLSRFFNNRAVAWYYAFSAYWFGLVNFLFFGGLVFFAAMAVSYSFNIYPSLPALGAVCFGAAFLIHLYATWNSGRAEITKVRVDIPGLPPSWKGRTVVFVSDVHLGNVRGKRFAAKVAEKIKALSPWALFIGGDLYDGTRCDERDIITPFRGMHFPGGSYFVTGNHEYYLRNGEIGEGLAAIRDAGIRVLNNEAVDLDGVRLAGIDDRSAATKEGLQEALSRIAVDDGTPSILLRHIPFELNALSKKGFSLALFGHTHQGQIFPLNLITRRIFGGYDYGPKRYDTMQTYTSSGVGTWGPPLRLGTKSEIVLIEFH